MTKRIPAPIAPLLAEYERLVGERLPGLLEGLYLHGSLALDAFEPRMSDIDVLAVLSGPCGAQDLAALAGLHAELARAYPEWPLESSYVQPADLRSCDEVVAPHPHYNEGRLVPDHRELNTVTRWLVRERGIVVLGPPPEELGICVTWTDLIATMHVNMNTYWRGFIQRPGRVAWLLSDFGVQWAVLGVLRQLYSFREGDITSKVGAGDYALERLPARWHRIVREALRIRAGERDGLYRLRLTRALAAHALLRHVIAVCAEQGAASSQASSASRAPGRRGRGRRSSAWPARRPGGRGRRSAPRSHTPDR
jgi:hypothetical protein